MRRLLIVIGMLIVLCLIEPAISANVSNSIQNLGQSGHVKKISTLEGSPHDLDKSADLIKRLLEAYDYPSSRIQDVQILVGKIPENISPEILFPEGSKLVGSMVRNQSIEIVLNSNLTADQIFDFYQERMAGQNWSEIGDDAFGTTRGFLPDINYRTFCESGTSRSLTIYVYPGRVTDLRIIIDKGPTNACSQYPEIDWSKPLPRLLAPQGSKMYPADYGSGNGSVVSFGTLETDLDTTSLVDHYSSQIRRAGWIILEKGSCGLSSWSTWNFTDETGQNWKGYFLVLNSSYDPKKHFLLFRAEIT